MLVCTVIFGGTVAVYLTNGHSLDGPTPRLLLGVILFIYIASLGYSLQIRSASLERLAMLTWVSIGLDLAAWTALAYATGGASSPLSTFFGLSTLTAALVVGSRGSLWTALVGLGAYALLWVCMSNGWLPPLADQVYRAPKPLETTYQVVVTVTSVLLIAAASGSLAERLVITGDALVRAEASRATLAAFYEDVIRSIPAALITYDAEGRIDGANPFAAELLQVEANTLLGRELGETLPFIPRSVVQGARTSSSGDASLQTPSGTLPVSFHTTPLYARDGDARGGLVLVDDRSREERLRDAVEQAERFAVLGRLAAGMAHEIRNPLGAIQGCVELVRETARLDGEERDLLASVSRDVIRLNQLVTDMLQFARPREPELAAVDLVGITRDVVALARSSGGPESKVTITLGGDAQVHAVVDSAQIRQVLWNLLRNAAQVSRAGTEVRIEVRTVLQDAEISVHDRGPGIAPEMRDKLFDAFYSGTARGTGLGLAIVKRIAVAHKATVEIREREGGGSVFVFLAPLIPPAPEVTPRGDA